MVPPAVPSGFLAHWPPVGRLEVGSLGAAQAGWTQTHCMNAAPTARAAAWRRVFIRAGFRFGLAASSCRALSVVVLPRFVFAMLLLPLNPCPASPGPTVRV